MSSGTGAAVEEVGHSMAPSEAAKTAAIKVRPRPPRLGHLCDDEPYRPISVPSTTAFDVDQPCAIMDSQRERKPKGTRRQPARFCHAHRDEEDWSK